MKDINNEIETFLNELETDLETLRSAETKAIHSDRAYLIAAITLLKHLKHADAMQISENLVMCRRQMALTVQNYLAQETTFVWLYSKLSTFFRIATPENSTQLHKKIDDFFDNILSAQAKDIPGDEWVDLESPITAAKQSPAQTNASILVLNLRIQVNLMLEQICLDFDAEAAAIQKLIDADPIEANRVNILQAALGTRPAGSPQIDRLSTLLLNGAKMSYGKEANRDDVSTKALDQYKLSVAKYIDPNFNTARTKSILPRLQANKYTDNTKLDLLGHVQKLFDLEEKSGISLSVVTLDDLTKDIGTPNFPGKVEALATFFETLPDDHILRQTFQAIKTLGSQQESVRPGPERL